MLAVESSIIRVELRIYVTSLFIVIQHSYMQGSIYHTYGGKVLFDMLITEDWKPRHIDPATNGGTKGRHLKKHPVATAVTERHHDNPASSA